MKCNACYTENTNDAKYCLNCGRDITETYIGAQKNNISRLIVIIACTAIVVAASIIGIQKLGKLFEVKQYSECFVKTGGKAAFGYSSAEKSGFLINENAKDKNVAELITLDGKYTVKKSNGERVILERDGILYAFIGGELTALENCKSVKLGVTGANFAYEDTNGILYYVVHGIKAVSDERIEDFCVSQNGSYVAYKLKDLDGSLCIHDGSAETVLGVDMDCDDIICANSEKTAIFYRAGADLRVMVVGNGKKYDCKSFSKLTAVGASSVMLVKADGCTYYWEIKDGEAMEEKKVCDMPLSSMLTPEGYIFSGDDMYDKLYTIDADSDGNADSIIKLLRGKQPKKICDNPVRYKIAGDSSFLYYTDASNTLYRVDTEGASKIKKCGENVDVFKVAADSRTLYYLDTEGKLYKFDGYLSKPLTGHRSFTSLYISEYGYLVLRDASKCMYVYDGELKTIISDFENEALFAGKSKDFFFYISKLGELKIARENGEFLTDAEFNPPEPAASDSAQTEGN